MGGHVLAMAWRFDCPCVYNMGVVDHVCVGNDTPQCICRLLSHTHMSTPHGTTDLASVPAKSVGEPVGNHEQEEQHQHRQVVQRNDSIVGQLGQSSCTAHDHLHTADGVLCSPFLTIQALSFCLIWTHSASQSDSQSSSTCLIHASHVDKRKQVTGRSQRIIVHVHATKVLHCQHIHITRVVQRCAIYRASRWLRLVVQGLPLGGEIIRCSGPCALVTLVALQGSCRIRSWPQ